MLVHALNLSVEGILEHVRFSNLSTLHSPKVLEQIWSHATAYAQIKRDYTYSVLDCSTYLAKCKNITDAKPIKKDLGIKDSK